MKKGLLIALGELFLKSFRVQKIFKRKLIGNLSFFLKKIDLPFKIKTWRERIFVETEDIKKAKKIVKNIFGISWFSEAFLMEDDLKTVADFLKKNHHWLIEKNQTFALRVKKSPEIKETTKKITDILAKNIKRKVNLDKPDKEIFVEFRKGGVFIYFRKIKGSGGLPVGSSGRALSLISGGIDSPVASYLITKRGVENLWLHFHSFPLVSRISQEKVKELAQVFLNYQPHLKIYFVPFANIQIAIKTKILPKYRILFYRRIMFKIAQEIAKKESCLALVTGESLAQVSSQTLPNLKIIEDTIELPVLRPLIGWDKEEIIKLAKKINTYSISIKPQEDCCTLFTPRHSTALGNLEKIKNLEKSLPLKKLIKKSLEKLEVLNF